MARGFRTRGRLGAAGSPDWERRWRRRRWWRWRRRV